MVQRKTTKQYVDVEQIDLFGYGELAPLTLFPVIPVAVEEELFTDIALPFGEEAGPVAIEARAMGASAGAASNLVVSFEPAVLEPEPEVIPELIPQIVPAIEIPEIVTETLRRDPKHVVQPYWKEREYIESQIDPNKKTLLIERRSSGRLSVIPWDLYAAAEFVQFTGGKDSNGKDNVLELWPHDLWDQRPIGRPKGIDGVAGDGRAYFPDGLLLGDHPRQSPLVRALEGLGFTVIVPPSVFNWAKRAYRRMKREMSPFNLPLPVDERPLYDRLEVGMLLKCKRSVPGSIGSDGYKFMAGYNYIVVETDFIELNNLEDEEVEVEVSEESGAITLVRDGTSDPIKWTPFDGEMSDCFELEDANKVAFTPEQTFPAQYGDLYEQALKYIETLKLPLLDYMPKDLAQAVYYRNLAVTHPPRMGKTSFMFGYVEASKTKKALMATVSNGIKVFVREMKRLGITDYKVIKKLRDLNDPAKYHIVSHAWLKTTGKKKPAGQNDRLKEDCLCPVCQSRLVRYEHEIVKDSSGHIVLEERTGWPRMRQCRLVIANPEHPDDLHDVQVVLAKSYGYGWICPNEECRPENAWPLIVRSGLGAELFGPGGRVPPVDLKRHIRCIEANRSHFRHGSRQCSACGYVHKAWMPARYKRIGKRYSTLCVDEVHNIKSGSTDIARAIRGLVHAKRKLSASGTMMPTKPRDCFYPFSWTFGNNNYRFDFPHGTKGVRAFNSEYTQSITMVSETNAKYKKAVPYLKKPHQFAKWRSARTMFRHYEDPEAQAALTKAGLIIPKLTARPVELIPDPKQGILLFATVSEFDQRFQQYTEELRQKTAESEEGRSYLLNSAQVMARMINMKYAASLPGFLNQRLMERGTPSIYNGRFGGVKEEFILDKVSEKTALGEKVVIFSDHRAMQSRLAELLELFNPILFNTGWNQAKRDASFERFEEDDSIGVYICGPRAVNESIDLSAGGKARTVISPDLLWSPGIQTQAWSRILTPKPVMRECELYVLLTKYSIDQHIYNTFYSRVAAADQAMYGKVLTKMDKGFDVQYFVDQVLSQKNDIIQWLIDSGEQESEFMPLFHNLQQLTARGEDD